MGGIAAIDVEVAARNGPGEQKGAGFNPVWIDTVPGTVKLGHALNLDGRGAGSMHPRTHGGEPRG